MTRDTGLAATEKFLPKGGEHSSAALRRGKAGRRGNLLKRIVQRRIIFSCAYDEQPSGSVLKTCSQCTVSLVLRKITYRWDCVSTETSFATTSSWPFPNKSAWSTRRSNSSSILLSDRRIQTNSCCSFSPGWLAIKNRWW